MNKQTVPSIIARLVLPALIVITPVLRAAPEPAPSVYPPGSTPYGKTYAQWGAAWWQWVYSFPAGETSNPVQDPTGQLAGLGDQGDVFFLAGSFGTKLKRTCTIPAGKALLIPIINSVWVNLEGFGDDPWSDAQQAFALSLLNPFVDNAYDLRCQIDDTKVKDLAGYRTQTADDGEYMVTLPENGLWPLPAGVYGPSVDVGIYVMVAPLPSGKHKIRISSASEASVLGSFSMDVTYHLTVE